MKRILLLMLLVAICNPVSVSAQGGCPGNLIVNGDFELGNQGFVTDYTFVPNQGYDTMYAPKTYTVGTGPNLYHFDWRSYEDHTPGEGNMLIVNATDPTFDGALEDRVWEQTVLNVSPYTYYIFSYWVAFSYPANPPSLEVSINGTAIDIYDALNIQTTGTWVPVSHAWFSGNNTQATIKIVDRRPVYHGDDYALDDICFTAQPACRQTNLVVGRKETVVGDVSVQTDGTNLYVTYRVEEPWCLAELHLAFAEDSNGIPQKRDNPIPGKFAYHSLLEGETEACASEYTFIIPLADLPATSGVIAAHATVQQPINRVLFRSESAWGQGSPFSSRNWAMYFDYDLSACLPLAEPEVQ